MPPFRSRLFPTALAAVLLAAPQAQAQTTFTALESGLPPDSLDQGPEDQYFVASIAPGDVEGDGDFDLRVLASYVNFEAGVFQDLLTLYRNEGPVGESAWAFAAEPTVLTPGKSITGDIAWADYDNDGDLDAVVASYEATALYRNDGGTLVRTDVPLPLFDESAQFTPAPFDRHAITWADVDNDGDLDLFLPSTVGDDGSFGITALLRNDGPGGPGGWTFSPIASGLPDTYDAQSAWGDIDNDGDLDLLLQENETFDTPGFARIYRNDSGAFVQAHSFVSGIFGTAEWADHDSDGDLDVLLAGYLDSGADGDAAVRLLRNDAGTFTPMLLVGDDAPDEWLVVHAATWADYDGDGDVDIVVTGAENDPFTGLSVLFANTGGGFDPTDGVLPAQTVPDGGGAFAWFDLDGDGDLDHLVSTRYYAEPDSDLPVSETLLFRNDTPAANAAPTAPTELAAVVAGNAVTLSWSTATDGQTPSPGLTYNLRVTDGLSGVDIVSPQAVPGGGRLLPEPGNVSHRTEWTLRGLPAGTYTWTVQAIDNAFNGGAFAAEGTFAVGGTATDPGGAAPGAFSLAIGPNPARGVAYAALTLGQAQEAVRVEAFDALGRCVSVLHEGPLAAGTHRLALGAGLPAGAYVVRAVGASFLAVRRVTLLP